MNPVERVLDGELLALLDRLAAAVPQGSLAAASGASPTLRARLDEADARVAEIRAAVLADYGRWRRALEDVENLWALASWRTMNVGDAEMAPHAPQRSERPGEPVGLLGSSDARSAVQEPAEQATVLAAA